MQLAEAIELGPDIKDIVDYWSQREDECGLAVDWSEAHERCWRCGYKSKLQRCHIVPRSRSGKFTPDNVVLLCRRCHREAPNCTDPRLMWIWLRSTCVPLYQTFLISRAIQEYIRMFGRYPFIPHISLDDLYSSKFLEVLQDELKKTIVHYGEGRRNAATLACVFARTEERITLHSIKPVDHSADKQILIPLMMHSKLIKLLTILPNT